MGTGAGPYACVWGTSVCAESVVEQKLIAEQVRTMRAMADAVRNDFI